MAATRRSARPTPARRGPWAAAAGGPRAMPLLSSPALSVFCFGPSVSGYLQLVLHLWVLLALGLASGKYYSRCTFTAAHSIKSIYLKFDQIYINLILFIMSNIYI